ncbi:MAG: hypothetical protein HYX90_01880 [Chloroflexi bacterium]|nr:hypothetical protein [Chloroflexota bacterium]
MPLVAFPLKALLPGDDLSDFEKSMDTIIQGLTQWKPAHNSRKTEAKVTSIHAPSFEAAIAEMNNLFLRRRWGDGLPILPATREKVDWILKGTDLQRDAVVGKIGPVGGIATTETLAIALAMSGGRPEYLPVLLAAVQAVVDPRQAHDKWQATTNSNYPVIIVNGPVAREIRLNSGFGCLGPDPVHPAGASIGRALRLLLQNVGGAIPGSGTMSGFGGPARYTNIVFAEDEANSPWSPLHVERGFPETSSAVTVYSVSSTDYMFGPTADSEESALMSLHGLASHMASPNRICFDVAYTLGSPGVVIIPHITAQGLARLGWSKDRVKQFLWENSKIAWSKLVSTGCYLEGTIKAPKEYWQDPMPITSSPGNILIVVAGGKIRSNYWMQVGVAQSPTSVEVKAPTGWEGLLARAVKDIGPLPD